MHLGRADWSGGRVHDELAAKPSPAHEAGLLLPMVGVHLRPSSLTPVRFREHVDSSESTSQQTGCQHLQNVVMSNGNTLVKQIQRKANGKSK